MNIRRYQDVRPQIRDGDLLLFRRRGLVSAAGRGPYAHAGMAAWWGDSLFLLETLALHGGRAVMLSSQVEPWPERWDVFECNAGSCQTPEGRWPDYDRVAAVEMMKHLCGQRYGWGGLAAAALLHLPLVRCFVKADVDDQAIVRRPPFCSHAVAMCNRIGGGVDPVAQLADRLTEPGDLARSAFYRYRFTLA